MPDPTPIQPAQLARFRELVAGASDGTTPWLDELIREAGYTKLEDGVTQAELVRECGVTRSVLLDWELGGLPAIKERGAKRYPLLKMIAWMRLKFVRSGRAASAGDAWDQRGREAGVRLKELDLDEKTRTVIPRTEAEVVQSGMVGELKLSLFALASRLASQLEHRDAPAIRLVLQQHFNHLCRQMMKGRVPMPDQLQRELDAALDRYERKLPK